MSNPAMMQEAMTLKDQAGMGKFISAKGYELTEAEVAEVWAMASKVMAGQGM